MLPKPRSPKPVAVNKPRKAVAPRESNEAVADDPHVAVRQAVAPAVRLRREGLAALRAGRAAVAGQLFTQLVSADPVNPEAHLLLHAALKAQSRDAEAQAALLDGLNTSSDSAQLAKVLAHEMLAAGRVENARALLTTHRPDGAEDLDYEALLAAVNQRAGNHAVAAELYERLVARRPANGDWWVGLAISQEAQGLVNAATKSFATASAAGTLDFRLARYAAQRLERLEQGS
jgi:MSHA biogenesis protein MshN